MKKQLFLLLVLVSAIADLSAMEEGEGGSTFPITVNIPAQNKEFSLEMANEATVAELKEKIEKEIGIRVAEQKIIFKLKELDDTAILSELPQPESLGVSQNLTVLVIKKVSQPSHFVSPGPRPDFVNIIMKEPPLSPNELRVDVYIPRDAVSFDINVDKKATTCELKKKIQKKIRVSVDKILLGEKEVFSDQKVIEYPEKKVNITLKDQPSTKKSEEFEPQS